MKPLFTLLIFILFFGLLCAENQNESQLAPLFTDGMNKYEVYQKSDPNLDLYEFLSGVKHVYVITSQAMIEYMKSDGKYYSKYVKIVKNYLNGIGFQTIAINRDEHYDLEESTSLSDAAFFEIIPTYIDNYLTAVTIEFRSCNQDVFKLKSTTDYYFNERWNELLQKTLGSIFWHRVEYEASTKLEIVKRPTIWNNKKIIEYFTSNDLDLIEGVYEKYGYKKSGKAPKYKFGIVKNDNSYEMIYMDGAKNKFDWEIGEQKGSIEKTSIKNFYTVNWIMADKCENPNVYLSVDKSNILTFEFFEETASEKSQYIKIFPYSAPYDASSTSVSRSGSGFALSKNLLLTNYHVIEDADTIKVRLAVNDSTETFSAKVITANKGNDLALVQITDKNFSYWNDIPYRFSQVDNNIGEDVFTLGYPLIETMGFSVKLADGIISSQEGFLGNPKMYQVTVPIHPGNSGGPLFDLNGDLIGIVSARHTSAENSGYVLKSKHILEFLQSSINDIDDLIEEKDEITGLAELAKVYKDYTCLLLID